MSLETRWADGYKPFSPGQSAEAIDGEIAANMRCPRCGGECRYEPWTAVGSYIAMAVCIECGHETEF